MTNDELLALIDARAQADVDFAKLVDVRDDSGIAAALSAGRTRRVEHLITERGVISALGPVAGDAFLTGLYSFGTLPTDGWPAELAAAQPGIARIVSWLKPPADGVNLGDPGTAQFLGVMAAIGVPGVKLEHVATLLALATKPDPISWTQVADALGSR